jgi:uncharacterized damage-inducible protein DinB
MDPAIFRDLYAYNFWAHRQVWPCIEQLSEEQFTQDAGYSVGALRDQCVHVMAVESWWFHFLRTGELRFLEEEDYPTRQAIRAKWDDVEQAVHSYLATLTEDELQRAVRPEVWDEGQQPITVWQAMLQVANHSTDHRAQILAGLRQLGAPTVEQDYLNYLFAQQAAPAEA